MKDLIWWKVVILENRIKRNGDPGGSDTQTHKRNGDLHILACSWKWNCARWPEALIHVCCFWTVTTNICKFSKLFCYIKYVCFTLKCNCRKYPPKETHTYTYRNTGTGRFIWEIKCSIKMHTTELVLSGFIMKHFRTGCVAGTHTI